MNKSTRRYFLATSGAGVAAVGAATVLPASLAAAQQPQAESMINESMINKTDFEAGAGASLSESVLVCVSDSAADDVIVISGESEFTVTDPALAQRITQLSRRGA